MGDREERGDRSRAVLITDDESGIRDVLVRKLRDEGFPCAGASHGAEALELLAAQPYAVLLADIRMPVMNGFDLLKEVRATYPDTAVVMVSSVTDIEEALAAIRLGAYDYVTKPFYLDDVVQTVYRALERRRLVLENRAYARHLEGMVADRTRELEEKNRRLGDLLVATIQSLVVTLEARDRYTEGHSRRVSEMADRAAAALELPPDERRAVRVAGLFHDIGKVGIRENILTKAGKLTPDEYEHMKEHPVIGHRIVRPLEELQASLPAIRHHHEWYDGSGYPDGLTGSAIPLGARIIMVVDAFDAMTSPRPYRPAMSRAEALAELRGWAGRQFDPQVVDAFLAVGLP